MKLFHIYISTLLLLMTLLLATLVGGLIYADKHVSKQLTNADNKINSLNQTLNGIKSELSAYKVNSGDINSNL